ncbi:MAG: ANTAR domain-containing protein [Actinobacteria bacterium]|nr:MAG: ANTAR domain-containing protein [Actinomycetota bacterium]
MEPGEAYLSLLDGLRGAVDSDTEPRRLVDRAAGLLAGRVGCPVREAQSHLLRIAEEQERDPAEVAADVLAILDAPASPGAASRVRAVVQDALRPRPADVFGVPDDREPPLRPGTVQEIVHGLPGAHSWLVPVRDEAGGVLDFVTQAASPEAVDVAGRRGPHMVGVRVLDAYPTVKGGPIWEAYLQTLADGLPAGAARAWRPRSPRGSPRGRGLRRTPPRRCAGRGGTAARRSRRSGPGGRCARRRRRAGGSGTA